MKQNTGLGGGILKTCEFVEGDRKRELVICGRLATHVWTPRNKIPERDGMPVCQYHGEGLAGNFTDELKPMPT